MAKILLIDDDLDIRNLGSKVLTHAGHEVTVASDALAGMDQLNSNPFDLVISDANMPEFSGFDLIRTIRRHKRFSNLPVALLTALREKKDVQHAVDLGVDDYIVKPIDPLLIISKVEGLLNKKAPTQLPTKKEPEENEATVGMLGRLGLSIQILTLSETGATVLTQTKLNIGETIELSSENLKELGVPVALANVISVEDFEGAYKIKTQFTALKEHQVLKLRSWVIKQVLKQKLPA